jgi:hypothetical protein
MVVDKYVSINYAALWYKMFKWTRIYIFNLLNGNKISTRNILTSTLQLS